MECVISLTPFFFGGTTCGLYCYVRGSCRDVSRLSKVGDPELNFWWVRVVAKPGLVG